MSYTVKMQDKTFRAKRMDKNDKIKYIGCHLSSAGGYEATGKRALEIGANTFAFFYEEPERRGIEAR